MLTFKFKALSTGLIATAVLGITLASCSKDDNKKVLRSKEIELRTATETGGGKVILREKTDKSFEVTITINKSTKDIAYKFSVVKGDILLLSTPGSTLETVLDLGSVTSTTTGAAVTKTYLVTKIKPATGDSILFNYDDLLKYNAFARVHYVTSETPPKDSTVARANIGKL